MFDLLAVGGYSAAHLAVWDVAKNTLFYFFTKIIYYFLHLCYYYLLFCVFVLSVFFATKIIAFLNRAPKWELIKSRIAIKNN